MSTQENLIESIVELLNNNFDLQVELGEENLPVVVQADQKNSGSITDFVNQFIRLVENTNTEGKLNYYFDNELDFDTPEEFHRY